MDSLKLLGIFALLGLFLFASGCTQSSQESPTAEVALASPTAEVPLADAKVCRDVPYTEEECDSVKECKTETLNYTRTDEGSYSKYSSWNGPLIVHCTINNLDKEEGKFNVEIAAMSKEDETVKKQITKNVAAGASVEFSAEFGNAKAFPYSCKVIPPLPTKEICKETEKCETVTKYKEVCD